MTTEPPVDALLNNQTMFFNNTKAQLRSIMLQ